MFRKFALVLGATVAIGWGYGYGIGIYSPTTYVAPECYVTKQVVSTPVGPRVRRVTVCG